MKSIRQQIIQAVSFSFRSVPEAIALQLSERVSAQSGTWWSYKEGPSLSGAAATWSDNEPRGKSGCNLNSNPSFHTKATLHSETSWTWQLLKGNSRFGFFLIISSISINERLHNAWRTVPEKLGFCYIIPLEKSPGTLKQVSLRIIIYLQELKLQISCSTQLLSAG